MDNMVAILALRPEDLGSHAAIDERWREERSPHTAVDIAPLDYEIMDVSKC
jgi:hypothetical protein